MMTMSLAENFHPQNIPHFKKRRLAQMITLTLSLAGYGVVGSSAYAGVAQLECDVTSNTVLTVDTNNDGTCLISSAGHLTNEMSLRNSSTGDLTNNGSLSNYGELTNDGELTNNGTSTFDAVNKINTYGGLYNISDGQGNTSTITNALELENTGLIVNDSYDGGTSNLINNGNLTNSGMSNFNSASKIYSDRGLYNSSAGIGSTSTLSNSGTLTNTGDLSNYSKDGGTSNITNATDAEIENKLTGVIINDSYGGGTSNLTNSGALTNKGRLYSFSSDGGISNLTNSGTLTNRDVLHNDSHDGGTSNLTNSGTLTNNYELYSASSGPGSMSTLTNSGTLTNRDGMTANVSSYGGTSTLTNSRDAILKNYYFLLNANLNYNRGGSSELNNSGSLSNYYALFNVASGSAATSTLTNSGKLYNGGILSNTAYGLDSTSTLTNSYLLVNFGYLHNQDYGPDNTSTLTNEVGSLLVNLGNLANGAVGLFPDAPRASELFIINNGINNPNNGLSYNSTLSNHGEIRNYGKIYNAGTFNISATGALNSIDVDSVFIQTAGSTLVDGIIDGGTVDIQGGSLSGSGTIEAGKITIGEEATVKPGNSPGTLIMISDLELLGTLQTEIVSSTISGYDVLEVQGNVTFSDTSAFEFLFDDSYMAVDGDSFDFLSAYTFDFVSFDNFDDWFNPTNFSVTNLAADFGWSVSYTDSSNDQTSNYLSLNVLADDSYPNAVSAPATVGLFGLALTLMGWGGRRSSKLRSRTA
jgi:fibronectin-binding autotransporter adhesin